MTLGLLCPIIMCAALAISCDVVETLPELYSITVDTDGNGTAAATVNGETAEMVSAGTEVTLTADPKSGYIFNKWTVVSGDVSLSNPEASPAKFPMPAGDVKIKAEFIVDPGSGVEQFSITLIDDGNGTAEATVGGQVVNEAPADAEVILTADPDDGFVFDKWMVVSGNINLEDDGDDRTTFIMPAENVEIAAAFKPVGEVPVNYIQINDGPQREILATIYAKEEGAGFAFAVSPMDLTDRQADVMEKRFVFFIPVELMNTDVDMATSSLESDLWDLTINLFEGFLNRRQFESNYDTTGTFNVTQADGDNFVIDFTDFAFSDGTTVSMHYEGAITKKDSYGDFMHYTAALATYDIRVGNEVINTTTVGYYQTEVYEEEGDEGMAMLSNIWGYMDTPYAFFDVYLINPDGETFTEATYTGTDYSYTNLEFDGAFETNEMSDYFLAGEDSGTVAFAKTATTFTLTFTEVVMFFDEELILNGTIIYDVAAPLSAAAPAMHAPKKMQRLNRRIEN